MTLDEMRRNIQFALGLREPEELPIIDQKINAGVRDVLRRTGCFVQCFDTDVPDGSNRIEFGPGIMRIMFIDRSGLLERVTYPMLQSGRVTRAFAQVGNLLIFSEPFAYGEQLQLYAVPRPLELSAADDAFEDETYGGIPEEFQDAVELYAKSKLAGDADDQTSQMGNQYAIAYIGSDGAGGRISEIKKTLNTASGRTLGPAQVSYSPARKRLSMMPPR